MPLYYVYALVVGIALAALLVVGILLDKRSWVLFALVFSCVPASPITSFTRGSAGAVYPSDIVAAALLFCLAMGWHRKWLSPLTPSWYKAFRALLIVSIVSAALVTPFTSVGLEQSQLAGRVRGVLPGVPLWLLMAGFRIVRLILLVPFFSFGARLAADRSTVSLTNKLVILGIAVLALAEILTVAGVVDLGLYLPGIEYQAAHILGHPKAVVGRLCVLGGFLCAMYLYSLKAPFWYVVIGLMVAGLLFSGSRAGILGLGVGLGVLGLRGRFGAKVGALAVLGVVVAGVVVLWHVAPERFERILADPYASLLGGRMSRWRIWVWTLSYLLTHAHVILTGVGFMNFQYALYGRGVPAQHGHNDYLTAFTELGLVGGVLFILFIYRLAKAAHRRLKATYRRRKWEALCFTAALGALVVTSLFEYCFYFAAGSLPMNRIFAMVFGVNTACWLQEAHQVEVWDLEAPQELGPYAGVEV